MKKGPIKSVSGMLLLVGSIFSGSVAAYWGAPPPGYGYAPHGGRYGGQHYAQPYRQQRLMPQPRSWGRGYGWRPPYFGGPSQRAPVYRRSSVRKQSFPAMCP